jgi:hypothetical protein
LNQDHYRFFREIYELYDKIGTDKQPMGVFFSASQSPEAFFADLDF